MNSVKFSAFITVINCHDAAVTSNPIIWIGPLSLSADVPVEYVVLLWPCMGLNMLIHASQPQEEDLWVTLLQNLLVTKQGCADYLGGACSHRLLRTHYTVLEGNQRNFRNLNDSHINLYHQYAVFNDIHCLFCKVILT